MNGDLPESVELPIDGFLDLHPFAHRDLPTLIPDYLELCRQRGIDEVRIVHGKGVGVRQRTVHTLLDRLPQLVARYVLADPARGGWGATIVFLRPSVTGNHGASDESSMAKPPQS